MALPKPPDWICEYGKLEWKTLIKDLEDKNLLSSFDLNLFAMYCDALGNYRFSSENIIKLGSVVKTKNGMPMENPHCYLMERYRKAFLSLAVQLGLTPKSKLKSNGRAKMSKLDSIRIAAKHG